MKYYLKKYWSTVTAASLCVIVAYGLQVCTGLMLIEVTQGLLDGDMHAFVLRLALLALIIAQPARLFRRKLVISRNFKYARDGIVNLRWG